MLKGNAVLGALVQSVNKMDLISALKFLKLEDISQGDSPFIFPIYHLTGIENNNDNLEPTWAMSRSVLLVFANQGLACQKRRLKEKQKTKTFFFSIVWQNENSNKRCTQWRYFDL